jgi:quercetin dioxygenase-like cupin family protein
MIRRLSVVVGLALLVAVAAGFGAKADKVMAYKNITVTAIDLGNPSADVVGRALSYPTGKPIMKAYKITIPAGKSTIVHRHQVSIFAYILSGTLEVDYGAKGKKHFAPGDGFLEAVNWCHQGRAIGNKPAVLMALYLGDPKLKNTIPCKK